MTSSTEIDQVIERFRSFLGDKFGGLRGAPPEGWRSGFSDLTFEGYPLLAEENCPIQKIFLGLDANGQVFLLMHPETLRTYAYLLSREARYQSEPARLMPATDYTRAERLMFDERLYSLLKARSEEAAERYLAIADQHQSDVERMLREFGLMRVTEFLTGPEGGARLRQLAKPVCPLCAINMIYGQQTRRWNCANCAFELPDEYLGRYRGTRRNSRIAIPAERVYNPDMDASTLEVINRSRTICFDDTDG